MCRWTPSPLCSVHCEPLLELGIAWYFSLDGQRRKTFAPTWPPDLPKPLAVGWRGDACRHTGRRGRLKCTKVHSPVRKICGATHGERSEYQEFHECYCELLKSRSRGGKVARVCQYLAGRVPGIAIRKEFRDVRNSTTIGWGDIVSLISLGFPHCAAPKETPPPTHCDPPLRVFFAPARLLRDHQVRKRAPQRKHPTLPSETFCEPAQSNMHFEDHISLVIMLVFRKFGGTCLAKLRFGIWMLSLELLLLRSTLAGLRAVNLDV